MLRRYLHVCWRRSLFGVAKLHSSHISKTRLVLDKCKSPGINNLFALPNYSCTLAMARKLSNHSNYQVVQVKLCSGGQGLLVLLSFQVDIFLLDVHQSSNPRFRCGHFISSNWKQATVRTLTYSGHLKTSNIRKT